LNLAESTNPRGKPRLALGLNGSFRGVINYISHHYANFVSEVLVVRKTSVSVSTKNQDSVVVNPKQALRRK
jgi:hypothetical protein